jgi:hypothetical protein
MATTSNPGFGTAQFERQQIAGAIERALCGSRLTAKATAAQH